MFLFFITFDRWLLPIVNPFFLDKNVVYSPVRVIKGLSRNQIHRYISCVRARFRCVAKSCLEASVSGMGLYFYPGIGFCCVHLTLTLSGTGQDLE